MNHYKKTNDDHLTILFGGAGKLGSFISNNFLNKYSDRSFLIIDRFEKQIESYKKNFSYCKCDALSSEDIKSTLNKYKKTYKNLSVVNLIGFDFPVGKNNKMRNSPISVTDEELNNTINLNLFTSHNIVSTLVEIKIPFHLIFMSSIYAYKPTKSSLYENDDGKKLYKPYIYGASKMALEKLAKDLSTYLPMYKSRINTISLGGVNLDLPDTFVKKYSSWSPQKCMVNPMSFYELLDWLIFNSPYELNGCNLKLDSGLSNT